MRIAVAKGIPIMEVAKTELDRMTEGGVHQGLVLSVPEYKYSDIRDLENATLLVALDGVTDPRNLGAIARSAAAFGADGIIVPTRRSVGVTASAWKTSAGALSRVPVAQVTNMTRTLQDLQKSGFTVIGLAADADVDLGRLDRSVPRPIRSSSSSVPRERGCPGSSARTATGASASRWSAAWSRSTPPWPRGSSFRRCSRPVPDPARRARVRARGGRRPAGTPAPSGHRLPRAQRRSTQA